MKDTGNFLPGHGGILDRIDGILLGIIWFNVFLNNELNEKININFWFNRVDWFINS